MVVKGLGSTSGPPNQTDVGRLVQGGSEFVQQDPKTAANRAAWNEMFGLGTQPKSFDFGPDIVADAVPELTGALGVFRGNVERLRQAGASDNQIQAMWDGVLNEGRRPMEPQSRTAVTRD